MIVTQWIKAMNILKSRTDMEVDRGCDEMMESIVGFLAWADEPNLLSMLYFLSRTRIASRCASGAIRVEVGCRRCKY